MTVAQGIRKQTKTETWGLLVLLSALLLLLILAQAQHRFLTPPHENDFAGFAARASSLRASTRLDGFYPMGYPTLLWLIGQAVGDAYVAAKIVAVGASLLLVYACWLFSRLLAPKMSPWLAAFALIANPYFWQSAIFVGTDMLWAALQCLSLYCFARGLERQAPTDLAWSGALLGLAYLVRYTALVMVPVVWVYLVVWRPLPRASNGNLRGAVLLTLSFLLLAMPQLVISCLERGNPFFNLQAKNVWFGIYGQGDWTANWVTLRSDITLLEVIRLGPGRFLSHWAVEYGKWWAYTIALTLGISRVAFQQATPVFRGVLVTLLALPGCVLAYVGIVGRRASRWLLPRPSVLFLGLYYAAYGLSVSLVFALPRSFLAVLPLLLLAAVGCIHSLLTRTRFRIPENTLLACLGIAAALNSLLVMRFSLVALQPPVAQVENALNAAGATPGDVILASFSMPYAYHTQFDFRSLPLDVDSYAALETALVAEKATFLLYESEYGQRYWPGLADLVYAEHVPSFLARIWQADRPETALFKVARGS